MGYVVVVGSQAAFGDQSVVYVRCRTISHHLAIALVLQPDPYYVPVDARWRSTACTTGPLRAGSDGM